MGMLSAVARRMPAGGRRIVRRPLDEACAPVSTLRGVWTERPVVALSYDDGPDPVGTVAVLDALAESRTRATFFQLVERAERHPEVVRRVVAAGHEVGLHGIDHRRLTRLRPEVVDEALSEGRRRLEAVAGGPVRLFRPPHGAQTLRTYLAARRAGLDVVAWGPTAADWVDGAAAEVAGRVLTDLHPGGIVLLHDAWTTPPGDPAPAPAFDRGEVTRWLLRLLGERGYSATSVTGLLGHGRPWRAAWFRG